MLRVTEVRPLPSFHVWVRFSDGVAGEVNLSDMVGRGVFAAWTDPAEFARVVIDPETQTLMWPGGIDLCPQRLHDDIVRAASRAAEP